MIRRYCAEVFRLQNPADEMRHLRVLTGQLQGLCGGLVRLPRLAK
jgi:hypothetical protein